MIILRKGRRVRRLRTAGDGGITTVEAVFTVPVLVMMILAIVQTGLWWYARQLASTAAQEAARTAGAYNSTAVAGQSQAQLYLRAVDRGATALRYPSVNVYRGTRTVTVRVTGSVVSLVPWLTPTVTAQIRRQLETYVPVGPR